MLNIKIKKRTSSALKIIIILIFSVIISYLIGYGAVKLLSHSVVLAIVLLLARKNIISAAVVTIFLLTASSYIPFAMEFGELNDAIILSVLQTDISESQEFLSIIPIQNYAIGFCVLLFSIFYFYTRSKKNNKKAVVVFFVLIAIFYSSIWPSRWMNYIIESTYYNIKSMNGYKTMVVQSNVDFKLEASKPRYQTVVVVIGESARKDYLSVYGYPLNTTPWLNNAPGIFLSHYVSVGAHTVESLPGSLVRNFHENGDNISENIVNLSNKAGYLTWWISNQGSIGRYDTIISAIGHQAKNVYFLNSKNYESNSTNDSAMLELIDEAIKATDKKQIIFVHMMGSHENPCMRLYPEEKLYQDMFNETAACYVSTIRKLDGFLEHIDSSLKNSGKSYAMVYFSDHGITVDNRKNKVRHDGRIKNNYEVPFVITASDIKEHKMINNWLSAHHFMGIFEWITGIRASNIQVVNPITATDNNITVYDGGKNIDFSNLKLEEIAYPKQ